MKRRDFDELPRFEKRRKQNRHAEKKRMVHRCPKCGKVCFGTHEAALLRIGEILEKNPRLTLAAYRCPQWPVYHLTSHPYSQEPPQGGAARD